MFRWLARCLLACFLVLGCYISSEPQAAAQASEPVVHAVLFYSPNCGHCHYVITEVLPPLFEQYGDQLQILGVDASQPDGNALFRAALSKFGLESGGVPLMVIGDTYLVGSVDIPEQLPVLVEQHLAQGGLAWPDIPGLPEVLEAAQMAEPEEPASTAAAEPASEATDAAPAAAAPESGLLLTGSLVNDVKANFTRDLAGNILSVIVLVGMVASVGGGIFFWRAEGSLPNLRAWILPVLCIVGLVVAGYLAYVEVTQTEAVCGPVGDCNTVQQSSFALLFNVLPVGVLGLAGYVAILAAWVVGHYAKGLLADLATAGILGMTTFGLLFSIYLTFLEPFVIGATCAWCLTSAVLMTALFWLSLAPGRLAVYSLLQKK